MLGKKLFRFVLALNVALGILLGGTQLAAAYTAVTEGDVHAALGSWDTGLRIVRDTPAVTVAAPAQGQFQGRIRPGGDGDHYCAADWHVILIALITGGDSSFTYQDAVDELSPIKITYTLDGAALPITQTPIVRRTYSSVDNVEYGFAAGSFLSPSALTVGKHRLTTVVTDPAETLTLKITFYMDAPGTGVCAQ